MSIQLTIANNKQSPCLHGHRWFARWQLGGRLGSCFWLCVVCLLFMVCLMLLLLFVVYCLFVVTVYFYCLFAFYCVFLFVVWYCLLLLFAPCFERRMFVCMLIVCFLLFVYCWLCISTVCLSLFIGRLLFIVCLLFAICHWCVSLSGVCFLSIVYCLWFMFFVGGGKSNISLHVYYIRVLFVLCVVYCRLVKTSSRWWWWYMI